MRKWIAKVMLLAAFAMVLGAGARVVADDVVHNPNVKYDKAAKDYDPDRCTCLYHVIEGFVIDLFD